MDTPPLEKCCDKSINMDDNLFPYLSQSYNQFKETDHNTLSTHAKKTPTLNGNHSDFEADSMPESQMELTEVLYL